MGEDIGDLQFLYQRWYQGHHRCNKSPTLPIWCVSGEQLGCVCKGCELYVILYLIDCHDI
jgi:hypothetical protein